MNDFIEINDGIFVKLNAIEGIVDVSGVDEINSKIYTNNNTYLSILPVSSVMEIIGMNKKPEENSDNTQEQMLNIMKQQVVPLGR